MKNIMRNKLLFFFVDAEKAFDNVNWEFMFALMDKLEIGETFTRMVKSIYSEQSATLIVNTDLTEKFRVEKGTRQGCPLSPLLFVMVLEVLLQQIQEDQEIKGLNLGEFKYKYRAFADDVMFIMEEPLETMVKLLDMIQSFGELAGFYINRSKSKLLCKNMTKDQKMNLSCISGCEIVQKVKYLGINLTNKNIDLYKNNYEKIWKQIERDLIIWNKLNLSLLGRISVIKMNVLPRVMFLLQCIPIINESKVFDKWQRTISNFIWAGKKPRVKMKVLCDARERGGLRVPNFKLYHEAICLSWLREWIMLENRRLLKLEGYGNVFGWHAYLMYDKKQMDKFFTFHLVRRSLFKVWTKYKLYLNKRRPMWIVPYEVLNVRSFLKGEEWIKYKELILWQQGLPIMKKQADTWYKNEWLKYRQIYDLFHTDKRNHGFREQYDELELILLGEPVKLISKLYKYVLKWYTADEMVKVQMVKWAINVNTDIPMEAWEHLWSKSLKISVCNSINENVYKMMYRWYLTPKKISKMVMDSHYSNKCWKCEKHEGSFYHMWWSCDKAKQFWTMIHKEISKVLCCNIEKKPEMFLIGLYMEKIPACDRKILWYMLTAARLIYAQNWRTNVIPDIDQWMKKMMYIIDMDRMTFLLREESLDNFFKDWFKFRVYMKKCWHATGGVWMLEDYF